jgi:AraC-like DNA-binding protein
MDNYSFHGFYYPESEGRPYPVAAIIQEWTRQFSSSKNCLHPDVWVLDYVLQDSGRFSVGGLPWQPRPANTAHLYPPGTLYSESCDPGLCKSGFFLFKGESCVLRHLTDNPAGFAQIIDNNRQLLHLLRSGTAAAVRGNRGYWQLYAIFGKVMEFLEHQLVPGSFPWQYELSADAAKKQSLASKVAGFLVENYRRHLTLDEIAAKFHCSKSTLVHQFRHEFGESVFEMLMRIRVEQSIPLLISGNTLKEIAEATGFASEFYYSRVFSKVMGISPGHYRNKLRN